MKLVNNPGYANVRPEDLLHRDEQPVASQIARSSFEGRRVVVTGAAGSIGSELVRQLIKLNPEAVYRLDCDESRLHALQLETTSSGFTSHDEVLLGDIRSANSIQRLMDRIQPDVVFHAAALKHLNLLERYPCEAVKTNVMGTNNVVDAALDANVQRVVNISTDKAADPLSILGASKRLAEAIVQLNAVGPMKAGSVRFGNVLGSRGSLFHTLMHQLKVGKPLTITHPDVTRFFMTIPEAVGLVLEAASLAQGGETFVLDMGEPVRILDVAERLAKLANMAMPEVIITGMHPGEKLHETLFSPGEIRVTTNHPRICSTAGMDIPDNFGEDLAALYSAASDADDVSVHAHLHQLLPTFQPAESPISI